MKNAFNNKSFDQIVIGNGSSALNFLHSAREGSNEKFNSKHTLVIGKCDLWSRTKPDHAMGQPPELLQRQLGSERYPTVGEKYRPTGLDKTKGEYVTAGSYTDHLADLRRKLKDQGGINIVNEIVAPGGISENGGGFKVVDESGNCYLANNVIVASGIGPARTLEPLDAAKDALSKVKGNPLGYDEIVDAVTYYNSQQPKGHSVLVYGGSATASWATNHAWKMQAKDLIWMCRSGIDQISTEGNPVGRNSEVIQMAVKQKLIMAGEIKKITPKLEAKAGEPRLKVELKIYGFVKDTMDRTVDRMTKKVTLTHKRDEKDEECTYEFHQVVYAVGSDPMGRGGPGNILAANLRAQLEPVYAKNNQFNTGKDDILLAYTNAKQNLWVVGAAVFGGLGIKGFSDLKTKYARVGEFLPTAGTPPEGIAILSTTIDALTGRMETDPAKFDWNRARPEEIANLFRTRIKLDVVRAEAIAQDLVTIRSDRKFVLTHDDIREAIADFNMVYKTHIDVNLLQLRPATRALKSLPKPV
jgi:hypothetical protein